MNKNPQLFIPLSNLRARIREEDVLSAAKNDQLTEAAKENRRGRFKVSVHYAHELDFATLVDSHVLVTTVHRIYDQDAYIVDAFGPLFDKFDGVGDIPLYECIVDIQTPGAPKFKMVRQNETN